MFHQGQLILKLARDQLDTPRGGWGCVWRLGMYRGNAVSLRKVQGIWEGLGQLEGYIGSTRQRCAICGNLQSMQSDGVSSHE